jgi:hypothetical protein
MKRTIIFFKRIKLKKLSENFRGLIESKKINDVLINLCLFMILFLIYF